MDIVVGAGTWIAFWRKPGIFSSRTAPTMGSATSTGRSAQYHR